MSSLSRGKSWLQPPYLAFYEKRNFGGKLFPSKFQSFVAVVVSAVVAVVAVVAVAAVVAAVAAASAVVGSVGKRW